MGISFEWDDPQVQEEEDRAEHPSSAGPGGRGRRILALLLLVAVLGLAVLVAVRWWIRPDAEELRTAVRLQLEAETSAVSTRNHDLFLTLHDQDPAWIAARYGQLSDERGRANEVLNAMPVGDRIHATLAWRDGGTAYRSAAFFRFQEGRLIRTATAPAYWGEPQTVATAWGALIYHPPDQALVDSIDVTVGEIIGEACLQGCISARLPMTLYLASDVAPIHHGATLSLPSPQLSGVTAAGEPHPDFEQRLQRMIASTLLPVTVRFGVPDAIIEQVDLAAGAFMAENPHVLVDLIPLSLLSPDPVDLLIQVDAAMIPPTPALITGGTIVDLTDYARNTKSFAYDDLYKIARVGSHWQERLWSAPQHAEYRVLYHDRAAFAAAVMSPEEYLRVLWSADVGTNPPTRRDPLQTTSGRWQLMDVSRHSLFAYAYDHHCLQGENRQCDDRLAHDDLVSALMWYTARLDLDIMPDVTDMNDEERKFFALNQLGYPRKVILWFETLGTYEHNTQLGTLDVTASPGVDGAGMTPFQVIGSVMSSRTAAPDATWEWIAYLSTWRPLGSARSMPVRASTAAKIGYWANLPTPIQPVVRAAFARGRGVSIEENGYFDWPLVNEVVVGQITAEEGAERMANPEWFGPR